MNHRQQQQAARDFAQRWQGRGSEKSDTHTFWLDLLENVYGVKLPGRFVRFEGDVANPESGTTNPQRSHLFRDAVIPETKVLIEQKSLGKDLGKPTRQSDGSWLRPEQQAKRYADSLDNSERPDWIVTCNFAGFRVYNLNDIHAATSATPRSRATTTRAAKRPAGSSTSCASASCSASAPRTPACSTPRTSSTTTSSPSSRRTFASL